MATTNEDALQQPAIHKEPGGGDADQAKSDDHPDHIIPVAGDHAGVPSTVMVQRTGFINKGTKTSRESQKQHRNYRKPGPHHAIKRGETADIPSLGSFAPVTASSFCLLPCFSLLHVELDPAGSLPCLPASHWYRSGPSSQTRVRSAGSQRYPSRRTRPAPHQPGVATVSRWPSCFPTLSV